MERVGAKYAQSSLWVSLLHLEIGKLLQLSVIWTVTQKNVIHALICQNCDRFYTGQTGIELRIQMTLHRQQTVRDEFRVFEVNKHVHEFADYKVKVVPIYKINYCRFGNFCVTFIFEIFSFLNYSQVLEFAGEYLIT